MGTAFSRTDMCLNVLTPQFFSFSRRSRKTWKSNKKNYILQVSKDVGKNYLERDGNTKKEGVHKSHTKRFREVRAPRAWLSCQPTRLPCRGNGDFAFHSTLLPSWNIPAESLICSCLERSQRLALTLLLQCLWRLSWFSAHSVSLNVYFQS